MTTYSTTIKVEADTTALERARATLDDLAKAKRNFEEDKDPRTGAPNPPPRAAPGGGGPAPGGGGGPAPGGGGGGAGGDGADGTTTYWRSRKGGAGQAWRGGRQAVESMLREPGYGGVGRVLGAVPILGAAVAGGIMSLLDVRQQYTSYEAAMTRRLGLEGDVSLPLLEDVGGQLGMGPVELHGEIATLLGGGYSPGSLRGSQRGKAMELALKTSKAFGVSAGTMGGVLGMFRPGGGVAPEHMTAGAPEGLIYSALTAARKSGMAPADIERYLSKIATSTAKMAGAA